MFNSSGFNTSAYNGDGGRTPGTHFLVTISELMTLIDRLIVRLNGLSTGMWRRVTKSSTSGITRIPKDSSDWNITGRHPS